MFNYSENLTESEKQRKIENKRAAIEVCRENYQHVKEHRALKLQNKMDDQVRRDHDTLMMDQYAMDEKNRERDNLDAAREVCRENYQHVKEHRALEQQDKIDGQVRRAHDNKMMDQYAVNEKTRERDNLDKQTEYGEFLSKQMNDKERQKHQQVGSGMTSAFNEESIDPVIIHNLKLMKQEVTKNALDECIQLRNERKQASEQQEVEEENERMDFLNKRENDGMTSQEQANQLSERKEMWKYEVASTWRASNDEAVKREKFIDTLTEQDLLMASNEKLEDQLEAQKKINYKKELLKQMEERNQLSAQQAADEKKEFQKLLVEVAKDEEIQQKLKDEEKQKKIEFNKSVLNSLSEKAGRLKMDSNDPWK